LRTVTLFHRAEIFTIPIGQATNECNLLQNNPILVVSPYRVQFPVSLSIFWEFLSALEGNAIQITKTNFTELQRLCEEFVFSEITVKLSKFSDQLEDSLIRQIRSSLVVVRSSRLSD
jgi:hypothetical protein